MIEALNKVMASINYDRADPETLPWAALRHQHTAAIQSTLTEMYRASNANRMLAALGGVVKKYHCFGYMTAEAHLQPDEVHSTKAQIRTTHPGGGRGSSEDFSEQEWFDFNMLQSGHLIDSTARSTSENRELVSADYVSPPVKPVPDEEPICEDTPEAAWKMKHLNGPRSNAEAMRGKADWVAFASACGHTDGHGDAYGYFEPNFPGEIPTLQTEPCGAGRRGSWRKAQGAQGTAKMEYWRRLMEFRPVLTRIPESWRMARVAGSGLDNAVATRDDEGGFAMGCMLRARRVKVRVENINAAKIGTSWCDPGNGEAVKIGTFERSGAQAFTPPVEGDPVRMLNAASGGAVSGQE